ncbi:MAG TPA: SIS domain-containing protein [Tepidisphaeraceae bacterium]|jgi:D-sedoheptulose 7-phosphate isomerase|nr:SIS domain-containing protein [Tepidisphaeraceae bacterium]
MAGTISKTASSYIAEMARAVGQIDPIAIERFAEMTFDAWRDNRRVYVFGNGGSAYTSSHFVTDLVKTASVDGKKRLHAMSLVDNVGLTTAIANDISYEESFRFPLASYARSGDVAIGISCSGNSPNLLRACEWAKENGLTVIALTGFGGGKVKNLAHLHINVPSENYGVIEDLHLSIAHIVAQGLKARIAGQRPEVA